MKENKFDIVLNDNFISTEKIGNNFFSRKKMEQANIQLYINRLSNKILKVKALVMAYAMVISRHLTFLKKKALGVPLISASSQSII